jgi:hypothetical protein
MPDSPHDTMTDSATGSRLEAVGTAPGAPPSRRRGRPELMSRPQVLERILELAARDGGLFRVHQTNPDLYARARRQFGSWSSALQAAGVDYRAVMDGARRRSIDTRRANRDGR